MIELMSLSEINVTEVILGAVLTIISIIITITLYRLALGRKLRALFYFVLGFFLISLWSFLETLDELFVKNITREIIFNIGGRVILIIAMIILIFAYRKLAKTKYTR